MYAKIVNETTKEVSLAYGNKIPEGYSEIEVEQAYNGSWYVKGYAPEKPQEISNYERIEELKQFLADTDYIANKLIESLDDAELQDLKEKYKDVLLKRRKARAEINKLEQGD